MIENVLTVFISVAQSVSSVAGQLVGHTQSPCSQWAPCLQLTPRHKSADKMYTNQISGKTKPESSEIIKD